MAKQKPQPGQPTAHQDRAVPATAASRAAARPPAPPSTEPPPSLTKAQRRIKVRALQMGYYDHARRREGDVFYLESEKHFSKKWMVRVDEATPERVTTAKQALQQQHDEIMASRTPGAGTGEEPGGTNPLDV